MNDKLLKVLTYAKNNIQHPENRGYQFTHLHTDGIVIGSTSLLTAKQVRESTEYRIKKLEEYEEFLKDLNELLLEYKDLC